jgi:hypothetical protein
MYRAVLLVTIAIGAAGVSLCTQAIAQQVSAFERVPGGAPFKISVPAGYMELEAVLLRLACRPASSGRIGGAIFGRHLNYSILTSVPFL